MFGKNIKDIEKYLQLQNAPFILKTPFSSSGRGLHWIYERKLTSKDRTWIEGAIKKQECISIETALDKQQDFAMEFYSNGKGDITYKGLSVFGAGKRGAYSGNVLGSQNYLESYFLENFGNIFQEIKDAVQKALGHAYVDRRDRKHEFRTLWIARINAAVREEGLTATG